MNAAAQLAQQLHATCVIFHDVDMFPQDDRMSYGCPSISIARHLGAYVNSLGYELVNVNTSYLNYSLLRLWYDELVGGVLAMNLVDYRRVNGYSNSFWAWGGEDDDMGTL